MGSIDPEGIAYSSQNALYISSEGDANNLVPPFINKFSVAGEQMSELPVPNKFLPTADNSNGIRNNEAFESLTLTPDQQTLFTAVENALIQDGPSASLNEQSPSRILRYDVGSEEAIAEYLYLTDTVRNEPIPADGFAVNGLVELLALDNEGTLLALERSFSEGVGNSLRLYEVSLEGASDIHDIDCISDAESIHPVQKRLLLDFDELGIQLDNGEALSFGPKLEDGRQTLIVASDNNFNPDSQINQFLAFALNIEPAVTSPLTGFSSRPADTLAKGLDPGSSASTNSPLVMRGHIPFSVNSWAAGAVSHLPMTAVFVLLLTVCSVGIWQHYWVSNPLSIKSSPKARL